MHILNPHIGITDFMNRGQVECMLAVFKKSLPAKSKRKLHVGVMASGKTLNGLQNSFPNAFPQRDAIAEIFWSDETYNCLHYADYGGRADIVANLVKAIEFGGIGIHALQLDMTWPAPAHIAEAIHQSRKNIEVILQLGTKALEEIDEDPEQLVERLQEYDGIIHRVLLDKSMGHGLGMDVNELLPYAQAIRKNIPNMGIGAAGGLGPDTMHLVEPFVEEFPDLSIDAEAQLRPSKNIRDPIDWNMAERYLMRAIQTLE